MAESGLSRCLLEAQDVLDAVLQKVHAAALRQLKAASLAWCNHVRRELCNRLWVRLCRREGQPEPAGVDSITDLDVECLNEAGRPWEVVVAGRQLPQLARLHGWGFVVDVQAVREARLEWTEYMTPLFGGNVDGPLGGGTLRSCIQGEGDPPDKLLLAAVACAASGTVRKVPVQRLREDDAIDKLVLHDSGIGVTAATLLGLMLPAATSLRSLDLKGNCFCFCPEGAAAIAEGLKGNSTLQSLNLDHNQLCGLDEDGNGTYTADGITKLCEALKGSAVTSLSLAGNELCGITTLGEGTYTTEGITKLCEGLKGSAVTSLNLANNQLCGVSGLWDTGNYTTEGIAKLCEGLNGSAVTSLNLQDNWFGRGLDKRGASLTKALKGNSTLQVLDLRDNTNAAFPPPFLSDQVKEAIADAAGSGVRIIF